MSGTVLQQPVTAIELVCTRQRTLLDRLRARLGPAVVNGLEQRMDHRPERAWHACSPEPGRRTQAAIPALLGKLAIEGLPLKRSPQSV
ncbi:MAG: hypothetical protein Q8L65_06545 [Burkholderiales bacterium]|nr:hypothetical protein [Burkholderiales bacterium]MDP2398885.1 hypothetical protein [Burkholderiales bacterium]